MMPYLLSATLLLSIALYLHLAYLSSRPSLTPAQSILQYRSTIALAWLLAPLLALLAAFVLAL